jgi:histidinol-phosphate aminotransferase
LVVLQTFSKAWGLAGLRLGMAFGHPEVITLLNKIKAPYNINQLTQQLGLEALGREAEKQQMVAEICAQREQLRAQLATLPGVKQVFPSEANFLLARVEDADRLYAHLLSGGIVVRNRSKVPLCESCLRLTVGTPEENAQLLEAIRRLA